MRPLFFEDETNPLADRREGRLPLGRRVPRRTRHGSRAVESCQRPTCPKGTWFDFWRRHALRGRRAVSTVPVTLETIPVLVRAGSFVPMTDAISTPRATTRARASPCTTTQMRLGDQSSGRMYEDDGESRDSISRAVVRVAEVSKAAGAGRPFTQCRFTRPHGRWLRRHARSTGELTLGHPQLGCAMRCRGCPINGRWPRYRCAQTAASRRPLRQLRRSIREQTQAPCGSDWDHQAVSTLSRSNKPGHDEMRHAAHSNSRCFATTAAVGVTCSPCGGEPEQPARRTGRRSPKPRSIAMDKPVVYQVFTRLFGNQAQRRTNPGARSRKTASASSTTSPTRHSRAFANSVRRISGIRAYRITRSSAIIPRVRHQRRRSRRRQRSGRLAVRGQGLLQRQSGPGRGSREAARGIRGADRAYARARHEGHRSTSCPIMSRAATSRYVAARRRRRFRRQRRHVGRVGPGQQLLLRGRRGLRRAGSRRKATRRSAAMRIPLADGEFDESPAKWTGNGARGAARLSMTGSRRSR